MEFLKYSNENQINIIPQENFEALVHEVFGVISSNLTKSLGPLGSSATILDGVYTEATKDGYSILNKYKFHNTYKRMIYNLIKAPCTKMNNTVGDGTTTAIALTNALFNRYSIKKSKLETLYRLPRQFMSTWDSIINEICDELLKLSTPIDPSDYDTIYNIVYVVSNGSHEISEAVANVYKEAKSPNIKQKDSPTNKSYIKAVEGFEFPTNAIDVVYVRNQDLTAEEKDVAVMVFNFKIDTDIFNKVLIKINDVMRAMGKKLIIVAPSYDEYMCESVLKQYVHYEIQKYGVLNLILTQFRHSDLSPYQLEDLSTISRGKIINDLNKDILINSLNDKDGSVSVDLVVEDILENQASEIYRMIGMADGVLTSCKNGCIFKVTGIEDDKDYQAALTTAEDELDKLIKSTDLEKQNLSSKVYDARSRVLQLKMNNFIYYIGADSALQKQIIWDAVEDVIKCLKSAIRHGVVPGCQIRLIQICQTLFEKYKEDKLKFEIIEMIYSALVDVYSKVLNGPDSMGMVKLIENWHDINSFYSDDDIKELKQLKELLDKSEDANEIELISNQIKSYMSDVESNAIKTLEKKAIDTTMEIIRLSITEGKVFDLETLDLKDSIITSAETDSMVLTVASELIKILINGNQCIFVDPELNNVHQAMVEI